MTYTLRYLTSKNLKYFFMLKCTCSFGSTKFIHDHVFFHKCKNHLVWNIFKVVLFTTIDVQLTKLLCSIIGTSFYNSLCNKQSPKRHFKIKLLLQKWDHQLNCLSLGKPGKGGTWGSADFAHIWNLGTF